MPTYNVNTQDNVNILREVLHRYARSSRKTRKSIVQTTLGLCRYGKAFAGWKPWILQSNAIIFRSSKYDIFIFAQCKAYMRKNVGFSVRLYSNTCTDDVTMWKMRSIFLFIKIFQPIIARVIFYDGVIRAFVLYPHSPRPIRALVVYLFLIVL